MNAVDQAIEPLPIVGPLCDELRALVDNNSEDWELREPEQTAGGTTEPYVLMGDSLRALDQYVLLEPPSVLDSGNRHGYGLPLRVRRRGDSHETELTLLFPPEMLPDLADRFRRFNRRCGDEESPE